MGKDFESSSSQSGGSFYKDYHKVVTDISNKSESTTHQHCIELFHAESSEKAISVLELMVNLNLEQVPEISFESAVYFKNPYAYKNLMLFTDLKKGQ